MDSIQINSSTAYTLSLTSHTPCQLTSKVTALVQTPVCHDTLAEKRIIKILKCFTISATPCITAGSTLFPRSIFLHVDSTNGFLDYKNEIHNDDCCYKKLIINII